MGDREDARSTGVGPTPRHDTQSPKQKDRGEERVKSEGGSGVTCGPFLLKGHPLFYNNSQPWVIPRSWSDIPMCVHS